MADPRRYGLINTGEDDDYVEFDDDEATEDMAALRITDMDICTRCQSRMIYDDHTSFYICKICGKERRVVGEGVDDGNDNATTNSMGLTGAAARSSARSSIRAQYNKIIADFTAFNNAFNGNKIPQDVYLAAAKLFIDATSNLRTKRGSVRRRLMAACQEYMCLEMKCPRTRTEICQIYNVPEGYTDGLTTLTDLANRGTLILPNVNTNGADVYLDRYFELLKIPPIYKEFICSILTESNRGSSVMDFKMNSRVAGCIHALVTGLKLGIAAVTIEKECGVKYETYCQFTDIIMNSFKYKKIFDKYGVPM